MLGFGRKRALEVDHKDVVVIERLLTGDVGRQLRAEAAEELRAERQALIDEIAATQAAIERDGPGLQKALVAAEAELERAENLAAAARAKRQTALNAVTSFSARTDRAILKAQAKLRELADPRVEELVLEIERRHDAFRNRRAVDLRAGTEPDPEATGPDQRSRVFASVAVALGSQMATLDALRSECRALVVNHAGDPTEALEQIRGRMPSLDTPLHVEHFTEQKPRTVTVRR
jgi:hypothetical protein